MNKRLPKLSSAPDAERPSVAGEAGDRARQAAVARSGILQRRADAGLQRIVQTAACAYHVPMAVISIIDRDREWFVARVGIEAESAPAAYAFCLEAIRQPGEPLVVLDASADRRFAENPGVIGPPCLRFYAGVPLLDGGGYALGALCIADDKPRSIMPSLFQLIRLARETERIIHR